MKKCMQTCLCLFLAVIMLTCGFAGCGKPDADKQDANKPYDNEIDIAKVQPQAITEEIMRLALPNTVSMTMSVVDDIDTLKNEGIVDTVRYNQGRYYSVTPLEDNQYLFLLYGDNDDSLYVVDGFLASTLIDKTEFQDIAVGMAREDVLERDPSACVWEKYSYHRFSDKSILQIQYELNSENKYIVSAYEDVDNSESVLNFLLKQDMDLISK